MALGVFGLALVSMVSIAVLKLVLLGKAIGAAGSGAGVRVTTRLRGNGKVEREFEVGTN